MILVSLLMVGGLFLPLVLDTPPYTYSHSMRSFCQKNETLLEFSTPSPDGQMQYLFVCEDTNGVRRDISNHFDVTDLGSPSIGALAIVFVSISCMLGFIGTVLLYLLPVLFPNKKKKERLKKRTLDYTQPK